MPFDAKGHIHVVFPPRPHCRARQDQQVVKQGTLLDPDSARFLHHSTIEQRSINSNKKDLQKHHSIDQAIAPLLLSLLLLFPLSSGDDWLRDGEWGEELDDEEDDVSSIFTAVKSNGSALKRLPLQPICPTNMYLRNKPSCWSWSHGRDSGDIRSSSSEERINEQRYQRSWEERRSER